MKTRRVRIGSVLLLLAAGSVFVPVQAADTVRTRYADGSVQEAPDFRRHVLPLLGRLGCNGRTCHGSFQGQGGFRLSLFGYDHPADHQAILGGDEPRVRVQSPLESPLLYKPTHGDEHGGGERFKVGDWPYHMIRRWIETGARGIQPGDATFVRLGVSPREIVFSSSRKRAALQVLAYWSDGSVEDVTPLCRYQSNDESIAEVDADGLVTAKGDGDTHIIAFYDNGVAVTQALQPVSDKTGAEYPHVPTPTRIDELVVAKLRKLGIVPAELCTDSEFLRRASLDITGTLPLPQEIAAFVADRSVEKRRAKIDELLQRPAYVARWTTRLCDILGNSPRQFEDRAPPEEYARHWYQWIARRVRDNVPYDELAAGIVLGHSRHSGESYEEYIDRESTYYRASDAADFTALETMPYYWAKHTSRTPEERALNVSYAFLGVRIDCAQCHKHPFDRWTQADFQAFTALFDRVGFGVAEDGRKTHQALLDKLNDRGNQAQRERARLKRAQQGETVPWKEVYLAAAGTRVENGKIVKVANPVAPRVLGGGELQLNSDDDPRAAFVRWMRRKDNPYFARVFINRVWAEYFGIGIIHPPDDMNLANPPSNAALLDWLCEEFVDHGFDMRWLHREIANSRTYQRALQSNSTNRLDERNFSRATARRLPAEMLFDAITQATSGTAELTHTIDDVEQRAIGPDGGAMVGRYKADDYASRVFGRSSRNANCDCGTSHEPNLLQAIYLQNDKDVLAAMNRKTGWLQEIRVRLAKQPRGETAATLDALVREVFLRTVSRAPTEAEVERSRAHLTRVGEPVEGLHELLWALLNSREFITNH